MKLPDDMHFTNLSSGDLERVQWLLKSNGLPFEDCSEHLSNFIGVKQGDHLVAIGGFERFGIYALLRSVAVDSKQRGLGIGTVIVSNLLEKLSNLGVDAVYILTESADRYFANLDFHIVERKDLPVDIQSTKQFQSLCPASALAMKLELFK